MTAARLTKRRTKLEKQATEVIGWLSEAKSHEQIANGFGCAVTSVRAFAKRHEQEIEERRQYYLDSVQQYDLAHRGRRIAGLDAIRSKLETEAATNGIIDYSTRDGTRSFPLSKELRAVYHDAAEQLGQLPRPEVNVQTNVVLVRQYGDAPSLD